MQAACRGRTQQQQQGQQWAEEQQWAQQAAAGGQKPVVVLVGATLDEPLVEHAAQQVGPRVPCSSRAAQLCPRPGLSLLLHRLQQDSAKRRENPHCGQAGPREHPADCPAAPGPAPAGLGAGPGYGASGRSHAHPLGATGGLLAGRWGPAARAARLVVPCANRALRAGRQAWRVPLLAQAMHKHRGSQRWLQHRAIVVDAAGKAAAMCRQIRDDLRRWGGPRCGSRGVAALQLPGVRMQVPIPRPIQAGCGCTCLREAHAGHCSCCSHRHAMRHAIKAGCFALCAGWDKAESNASCRAALRHALPRRRQSADEAPARVMVFAGSEEQARQLAGPLRTVLWGDHKISGGCLAGSLCCRAAAGRQGLGQAVAELAAMNWHGLRLARPPLALPKTGPCLSLCLNAVTTSSSGHPLWHMFWPPHLRACG